MLSPRLTRLTWYWQFLIDFAVRIFHECLDEQTGRRLNEVNSDSAARLAQEKAARRAWKMSRGRGVPSRRKGTQFVKGTPLSKGKQLSAAPAVVTKISHSRAVCVIYVAAVGQADRDWAARVSGPFHPQSIFDPAGPMAARHFDHLFGGRVQIRHVPRKEFDAVQAPFMNFVDGTRCRQTWGDADEMAPDECDEWSRMPPSYLQRFSQAVLSGTLSGGAGAHIRAEEDHHLPPGIERAIASPGVLVLERSRKTTKRLERALAAPLRAALLEWARAAGVSERIHFVELDSSLSVSAQAHLFRSARLVIAPHGAACTNIIFCARGTGFIELPTVTQPCYFNLAKRVGLRYASPSLLADNHTAAAYGNEWQQPLRARGGKSARRRSKLNSINLSPIQVAAAVRVVGDVWGQVQAQR